MDNKSQGSGLSKYEVQRSKFNVMPDPSKEKEEFAEEIAADAKAAFNNQKSGQQNS
ncbi:hypothetical protein ACE6ED_10455 [Paenibacillus sp. CN-4]|uniref:hypothetical protein n=1 Tax=Paenibacillus nanchangensis TaxID=3348343 RepID=UPI00397B4F12